MKITTDWLKDHLETEFNENQIIDKLTDVGLEVEIVEKQPTDTIASTGTLSCTPVAIRT